MYKPFLYIINDLLLFKLHIHIYIYIYIFINH